MPEMYVVLKGVVIIVFKGVINEVAMECAQV